MVREVHSSREENSALYDYLLDDGAVVIRKSDRRCIYMKRCRGQAIAIEGTVDEMRALALINNAEIIDMVEMAVSLPRLS